MYSLGISMETNVAAQGARRFAEAFPGVVFHALLIRPGER